MPFFDPPPEPEPQRRRRRRRRDDAWSPPTLEAPTYIADAIVLAEAKEVTVFVHGIASYRTGFALRLEATMRFEAVGEADEHDLRDPFGGWGRRRSEARFGIAFADGRRAEFGDGEWLRAMHEGDGLAISPQGSGGGSGSWRYEATATIDGQRILDAAALAHPFFPSAR